MLEESGGVHNGHKGVQAHDVGEAQTRLFIPKGEGLGDMERLGDARGLHNHVVEAALGGKVRKGVEQVFTQCAANAAIGELHDLLLRLQHFGLPHQLRVDVYAGHVIYHHCDAVA
eukprot:6211294-Pleurochrysis_carterae.AAC.4